MTTCLRASLLLAVSTVKVALMTVLGLALGLVIAPAVVDHVAPSWASSLGWSPALDDALPGTGSAPHLASWTDAAYLRSRWTELSAVLDD